MLQKEVSVKKRSIESDNISSNRDQAVQRAEAHYHVIAGYDGGFIRAETVKLSREQARNWLAWAVDELRLSGNRFTGSLKTGKFVVSNRTDAGCDYLTMYECEQAAGCQSSDVWSHWDSRSYKPEELHERLQSELKVLNADLESRL